MQKVSYMGNGTTTEFNFNFPYYENSNIVITKNNMATTGYTIIGTSGGTDADIPFIGGKVIFDKAPSPLDSITIARVLPLSRTVDYQPVAQINPTTLNQDMNYMMEVLKDFKDEMNEFRTQYNDITDNESAQILSTKIDNVSQAITNLGDISLINSSIATLNNRTVNMSDYVVASQMPSSSNSFSWYRKYKSGFVEFGGRYSVPKLTANSVSTVTVNTPLSLVVVNVNVAPMTDGGNSWHLRCGAINTGSRDHITLSFLSTIDLNNSSLWMYTAYGTV